MPLLGCRLWAVGCRKTDFLPPTTHYPPPILLYFLVRLMLAAKRAELAQLHALGFGLFVLGLAIVFPLALGALQRNDFAHFAPFRSRLWDVGGGLLPPTTHLLPPIQKF